MGRGFSSVGTAFLRDRRGNAGVEMALVTPLLIILMFGAFELGNYFWNEHIVVKAVRDAARFAGRQSFGKYDCAGITDATLPDQIRNVVRTGQISGGTARLPDWTDDTISISVRCDGSETTGIYDGKAGGAPIVTVSTTLPYRSLFSSVGFDTSALVLTASAQSAVMGI